MSVYSELSKKIGWDPDKKVSIPSVPEAKDLNIKVLLERSVDAYEKVFTIHRFAPSPDGGEDSEAMDYILEAYLKGRRFFE
jgi:hypothetical protein